MGVISASATQTKTFNASCPSAVAVGQWVHITGPKVGGLYQVDVADPTSHVKMPATGIVISKPTSITAVVQYFGPLKGIVGGLTPGKVCFVGLIGYTQDHPTGADYEQIIGDSISTDEIIVRVRFDELPPPIYVSHFNTSDGSNNCVISDVSTTSRYVSNPSGHFDIGDWVAGTLKPTTRVNLSYSTINPCSIISGSTFQANVYGDDGITIVASHSVSLTGNVSSTLNGITLSATGWSPDSDKFQAVLAATFDMPTVLPNGGRFSIELKHIDAPDGTFTKAQNNVMFDKETYVAALSGVSISETPGQVVTRFLSGVEYYALGSRFTVGVADIDNLNDETYPLTQVDIDGAEYGLPALALQGSQLTGWTNIWNNVNAAYQKIDWAITQLDYTSRTVIGNIRARTKDWIDGLWINSPNQLLLIETHDDTNTRLIERFYLEDWRCHVEADFDLPNAKGWVSSNDNSVSDALYFNGGCEHNKDNWGIYNPNPAGQPNYTTHAARQYLVREFKHDGSASSGFRLTVPGTYATLEYKLAKAWDGTPTGGTTWVNGLAAYNAALWNNGDPQGGSGGLIGTGHFTFGTNNIINCNDTLYVQIGLDPGQRITGPLAVTFD